MMTSRERVLAALERKQTDRVPFVEAGVDLPMQRALLGYGQFLPEELNEVMGLEAFAYALADDPGLVDTVLGRYAD